MATIIPAPARPWQQAGDSLGEGLVAHFTNKKIDEERRTVEGAIAQAPDYQTALSAIEAASYRVRSNFGEDLSNKAKERFPETTLVETLTSDGRMEAISQPKDRPLSDAQLAEQGRTRPRPFTIVSIDANGRIEQLDTALTKEGAEADLANWQGMFDDRTFQIAQGPEIELFDKMQQRQREQAQVDASAQSNTDAKQLEISRNAAILISEGVDPTEAVKRATQIAYSNLDVAPNPVTGKVEIVDALRGTVAEPKPNSGPTRTTPTPTPGNTLWDLAELATGPESAATSLGIQVGGIAGIDVNPEVIAARQQLMASNQGLISALAVNERFPVGEQERLRKETNLDPQILDSPVNMHGRMLGLYRDLALRAKQMEADANDTSLSDQTRRSQQANARSIRNYLATMGVPLQPGEFLLPNGDRADANFTWRDFEGSDQFTPEQQQQATELIRRARERAANGR
jgi:hypothetical protein